MFQNFSHVQGCLNITMRYIYITILFFTLVSVIFVSQEISARGLSGGEKTCALIIGAPGSGERIHIFSQSINSYCCEKTFYNLNPHSWFLFHIQLLGKGTISNWIVRDFGLTHVSSGDLLRANLRYDSQMSCSSC